MERKVAEALGYELETLREPLIANASVSELGEAHFRAELRTTFRGESHARVLEGESCAVVSDAVALVLAFLVDPEAASATAEAGEAALGPAPTTAVAFELTPEASPPPLQASPTPPPVQRVALTPAQDRPAPEGSGPGGPSPPAWWVRTHVGVDTGALPAPTSFLGLALGRSLGRFSVELSGARYSPRERTLPESAQTRGGDFQLWGIGGSLGYRALSRVVEVSPWLGAELGTVYGSGFGVALPKQGQGLWLAAAFGLTGRYRVLRWLGATAQAGVAVPLLRPVYVLDNVGDVYRASSLTARGSLGLEVYF